jgi:hypothetical protein
MSEVIGSRFENQDRRLRGPRPHQQRGEDQHVTRSSAIRPREVGRRCLSIVRTQGELRSWTSASPHPSSGASKGMRWNR